LGDLIVSFSILILLEWSILIMGFSIDGEHSTQYAHLLSVLLAGDASIESHFSAVLKQLVDI